MTIWELTLSSKGQVTLPKELRDALNLKPGDQVVYTAVDGELIVTPKNVDFADLAGLLGKAPQGPLSDDAIDEGLQKASGKNVLTTDGDDEADAAA